jgi:hypothetical protein
MSKKFFVVILSCLVAASFVVPSAFADHNFSQTGAGTFDSNDGGNWSGGVPSANGQDVNFTQADTASQTITNFFSSGGGALNYLRLKTTGGNAVTVITQSGTGIDSQFGLELKANDTLILNGGNSTLSHGNNSFDNLAGTLVLSNSAAAFVNIGGGNTMNNAGTITLVGDSTDLNYGQTGTLNNNSNGSIIKNGSGTGHLTGTFSGSNISILNNGTITVNGGTLIANTVGAFNDNGFHNASGARIFVNSGATFAIDRDSNAWINDGTPQNDGSIFLNDGSITVLFAGSQASDRGIQNNATISGSGTLALKVSQSSTGNTIASNGVLNIFQTVAGNQQTFTSVGGDFGTFKAVTNGTLRLNGNVASGMGGAWSVDNGGTLEVSSGNNVDLGSAFIPGSGLNGTIKVNSGANMTLASAAASGPTLNQNGTFLFNGGTISMPNVASLNRFTNSATGVFINDGNGVFRTGYGPGGSPNFNYGILNLGTVIASNGVLTMYSDDAADAGGFQNQGTVQIKSGGTLTITRSDNAWITGVLASPTNLNWISMQGGTLRGSNTSVGVLAGKLVNAAGGSISGGGAFTGFTTYENSGSIIANDSSTALSWIKVTPASDALFVVNKSGGIISANTARVIMNGVFTNQSGGTFSMISGVGTFNGKVVNSGAWVTDPSTNVFNDDHIITSSGFISAAAGDVYIFKSNFVNQSTQNTSYDTFNTTAGGSGAAGTKFIFDGTNTVSSSGYTQQFFTAGLKLTGGFSGTPSPLSNGVQFVTSFPAVTGFQNNFALDRLELGNLGTNSILELFDSFPGDGTNAALFVNDLWLLGSSQLILSNNTVLYFVNSNTWSMANISLLGNAEIHQLTLNEVAAVPEPSILLLWGCGIATVYGARRRAKKQQSRS